MAKKVVGAAKASPREEVKSAARAQAPAGAPAPAGPGPTNAEIMALVEQQATQLAAQSAQIAALKKPADIMGNQQDPEAGVAYTDTEEDAFFANGFDKNNKDEIGADRYLVAVNLGVIRLCLLRAHVSGKRDNVMDTREKHAQVMVGIEHRYTGVGSEYFPQATAVDLSRLEIIKNGVDKRCTLANLVERARQSKLCKSQASADGTYPAGTFMMGSDFMAIVKLHSDTKRSVAALHAKHNKNVSSLRDRYAGRG